MSVRQIAMAFQEPMTSPNPVLSINFLGDALRDILDVRETKTVT